MLDTTIAGSLPKPAWLARPTRCGRRGGCRALEQATRRRAPGTRDQEQAGIDVVTDGEQSRQHFVKSFIERIDGIDFASRMTIGIRADRYKADVPTVTGPLAAAAPSTSTRSAGRGPTPSIGSSSRSRGR